MHKKVLYHLQQLKEQIRQDCCGSDCMKCSVQFDLVQQYAKAGIPIKYWLLDIDILSKTATGTKEVQNYANRLKAAYDEGMGVYLYGPNGTGKTLAACSIAKSAIACGYTARYMFLGEVISAYSDAMYDKSKQEIIRSDILGVDFLVLDDLDKTYLPNNSEYIKTILDTLFRTRTQNNLPIITTANKSQQDLLQSKDVFQKSLLSLFSESLLPILFHCQDNREELKQSARNRFLK